MASHCEPGLEKIDLPLAQSNSLFYPCRNQCLACYGGSRTAARFQSKIVLFTEEIVVKLRKSIIFIMALWSGIAFAQDVGVTGAELLAGAGDAKLAALGRQAADSGKRVVVSAPDYWHDKVAQKILAGAHGSKINLVMKDSFVEAVVVRLEDKTADPAVATTPAKPVPPTPAPALAVASKPVVATVPATKPVIVAEPKPAPVATPAPVPAPAPKVAVAAAPVVALAPIPAAPVIAAPTPVVVPAAAITPVADETAAIHKRLEKSLNDGAAADGNLSVTQLEVGDQIYVDGSVRAVVRRKGARQLFWLDGELNLLRTELVQLGKSSYEVKLRIDANATPALRTATGVAINFSGKEPAVASTERTSLEKQLNDAHPITATVAVKQLELNDLIYVGADSAVVVRRSGSSLLRFWLVGEIDLGQSGVARESNGKYRVRSDTLK
jgi:hypothetical protein